MAAKAALGLLALAGLGLIVFGGTAKASNGGAGNAASNGLPGLAGCDVESNIPADLKATISQFLTKPGLTPADYTQMASAAQNAGYPKLAACLNQKATQVGNNAAAQVAAQGGMAFVIRYGDIPSHLADYYTGNATRWPELGPLNPQIGSVQTVNGVTNYSHWNVGTQILIPKAWNPLQKPLPAPLSGSGSAPSGSAAGTPIDISGAINTISDIGSALLNGVGLGSQGTPLPGDGQNGDQSGTFDPGSLPNNDNPGNPDVSTSDGSFLGNLGL